MITEHRAKGASAAKLAGLLLTACLHAMTGGGFTVASAQPAAITPYQSNEGIETATRKAEDDLPADSRLVLIGSPGDRSVNGIDLYYDVDRGTATSWGYIFYSPSRNRHWTIAVIQIPFVGMTAFAVNSPVNVPNELHTELATDYPFSGSETFANALSADTSFSSWRLKFADHVPTAVSYRMSLDSEENVLRAAGFPLEAPVWHLMFPGGGDSGLSCWMSAETGQIFCRRPEAAGVGQTNRASEGSAMITDVSAADGQLTVRLGDPHDARRLAQLSLYDVTGKHIDAPLVKELTDGQSRVALDVSNVPPGLYICRVRIGAKVGSTKVVIP